LTGAVARMEPTGLAFGEPEDRLRDIREKRSRIPLLNAAAAKEHPAQRNVPAGMRI